MSERQSTVDIDSTALRTAPGITTPGKLMSWYLMQVLPSISVIELSWLFAQSMTVTDKWAFMRFEDKKSFRGSLAWEDVSRQKPGTYSTYLTVVPLIIILCEEIEDIFLFFLISQNWPNAGIWNPAIYVTHTIVAADNLVKMEKSISCHAVDLILWEYAGFRTGRVI